MYYQSQVVAVGDNRWSRTAARPAMNRKTSGRKRESIASGMKTNRYWMNFRNFSFKFWKSKLRKKKCILGLNPAPTAQWWTHSYVTAQTRFTRRIFVQSSLCRISNTIGNTISVINWCTNRKSKLVFKYLGKRYLIVSKKVLKYLGK